MGEVIKPSWHSPSNGKGVGKREYRGFVLCMQNMAVQCDAIQTVGQRRKEAMVVQQNVPTVQSPPPPPPPHHQPSQPLSYRAGVALLTKLMTCAVQNVLGSFSHGFMYFYGVRGSKFAGYVHIFTLHHLLACTCRNFICSKFC